MKSLIQAVVVAAALVAPVLSFAQQSDAPKLTRAQVRAELVQLEQAGFRPGDGDNTSYPDKIQAAEAKVAARNGASSGYGGVVAGSSQSGSRGVSAADWNAMYSHP
ncbi:DUF4148 domain-containing protein [Paraburkholderia sp. BCC1884]|uniref:DUF4148 domain-containing protein n=1 Tax=Paraburkholderia sp. BCC1884 TaxID=2562668 RepID=UPI0011830B88|nr:DUF4148 domain-containing protein [Paraburkholderia sp. BCC1884]